MARSAGGGGAAGLPRSGGSPASSERVEFKRAPSRRLRREITAFTDAEGGRLIIGVDGSGNTVGTDVKAAHKMVTSALSPFVPPGRSGSPGRRLSGGPKPLRGPGWPGRRGGAHVRYAAVR
ncbi:ATP-binding protein [Methanoculleus sp. 10]|uniref:AlbA family DNA-binding domain-containing protein n=1 Tax=Methanoculleus sp. 10 TaxID=430615 RepID=UPI0034140A39